MKSVNLVTFCVQVTFLNHSLLEHAMLLNEKFIAMVIFFVFWKLHLIV